jgi:hypothetical protein
MCAVELFRQRPNFSLDLAEIICQKLATLGGFLPGTLKRENGEV